MKVHHRPYPHIPKEEEVDKGKKKFVHRLQSTRRLTRRYTHKGQTKGYGFLVKMVNKQRKYLILRKN
jgi:hypothetical protein